MYVRTFSPQENVDKKSKQQNLGAELVKTVCQGIKKSKRMPSFVRILQILSTPQAANTANFFTNYSGDLSVGKKTQKTI